MPAEKKPKIPSVAREGSPTAPKLVINLTSSKGNKEEVARSMPVALANLKAASSIAEMIAQRRSSSVFSVPKFVLKPLSGAKSGSPLEKLATMKSDKVPLPAKVAPKSFPSTAEIDSSVEKNETVRVGNREKFTKSVYRKAYEICVLLEPNLLEDMDVCAKFVDGVK
ncbi:uncharacterized protein LOC126604864 [Malus sylvestris]|uniref:uncharacterized protein LOC126604864 n=1 Tax=Malus sylvestris TaxID=3752 RepID=UPI0021AC43EA|nr:uncharacterized protein LOC126604864 [Malus sylvestris]XP_050128135.1 uncharacterized protein LOC126604864 [Malus sylvestris]